MKDTVTWLAEKTPAERCCTIIRVRLNDISRQIEKLGGENCLDKNSWLAGEIIANFEFLKERMKDLRISKEVLSANGIDFKKFRTYYFAAL